MTIGRQLAVASILIAPDVEKNLKKNLMKTRSKYDGNDDENINFNDYCFFVFGSIAVKKTPKEVITAWENGDMDKVPWEVVCLSLIVSTLLIALIVEIIILIITL